MAIKVLLVEDQDDLRHLTSLWLDRRGFEVLEAQDGSEGWDVVQEQHPDLVLTDIAMPVMDGVALCKLIKTTEKTADIPVVVFTSHMESEVELAGTSAGADAYLSKDSDPRILEARIEALLSDRNRRMQDTEKKVDSARRQTLGQSVITLAHHLNNSLISIHAAASVVNPEKPDEAAKLKNICTNEARKMLVVLKALKKMAEEQELRTTVYVGSELMFDLQEELDRLGESGK